MPGPEAEKALRKEQEPRRKQLNREIVRLQKKLGKPFAFAHALVFTVAFSQRSRQRHIEGKAPTIP